MNVVYKMQRIFLPFVKSKVVVGSLKGSSMGKLLLGVADDDVVTTSVEGCTLCAC